MKKEKKERRKKKEDTHTSALAHLDVKSIPADLLPQCRAPMAFVLPIPTSTSVLDFIGVPVRGFAPANHT